MNRDERRKRKKEGLKCDVCGKRFLPGIMPDGMPAGIGATLDDGKTVIFCHDCLIRVGEEQIKKQKEQKESEDESDGKNTEE